MIISLRDYFGPWWDGATDVEKETADDMLQRVNALLIEAEAHGVELKTNPHTGTCVSGETYGGFRPAGCPIGAAHSAHKQARAVDVYDPDGDLDRWITDSWLEEYGLYREAPSATRTWCHLTDRSPGSNKRTFLP